MLADCPRRYRGEGSPTSRVVADYWFFGVVRSLAKNASGFRLRGSDARRTAQHRRHWVKSAALLQLLSATLPKLHYRTVATWVSSPGTARLKTQLCLAFTTGAGRFRAPLR